MKYLLIYVSIGWVWLIIGLIKERHLLKDCFEKKVVEKTLGIVDEKLMYKIFLLCMVIHEIFVWPQSMWNYFIKRNYMIL